MKVRGRVIINIPTKSPKDCNALLLSLSVDEHGLPSGLSSSMRCNENVLIYELSFDIESERLFSMYNTLDDLIRNARVVLNSLEHIK